MPSDEIERLRAENLELRRRIDIAQAAIDELRADAIARRAEVRELAEALPVAISRHALMRQMLGDVRHHPDKRGVVLRAIRKLGRAPRKAVRLALRRG